MTKRTITSGVGLVAAVLIASGCGGGGGSSCTDECETLDETRCYGSIIETCMEDEDGCMVWAAETYCDDSGQFCDDSSGTPECVFECSDECDTLGEGRCSGSLIQTCGEGADGCLDWEDGADCGDTDQLCDDGGDAPACVDGCVDECLPADATRCSTADVIQTCTVGSDGCTEWVDGTDCTSTGDLCDDSTGTAACYTPCTGECDTEGDSQCSTDMVQSCVMEADGCLYWSDVLDCSVTGYYCDDTLGDAYCIRPCENECDTLGATQCSGEYVQTCSEDTYDGCYYWEDTTDCSSTMEACHEASGTAACGPRRILLMGEDVTSTGWDEYRDALTAAGVTWDEWDLDSLSFPTITELTPYHLLIWFDESTLTPGDSDCQVVVDWMALGARALFATSVDFLWDVENGGSGLGENNLYLLFETVYSGSSAGYSVTTLDGVTADPITDDFSSTGLTLLGGSDSSGDYADPSAGLATKAGLYGTGGTGSGNAGFTYYDSGTYKIAWLGLNFHNGLTDTTQKNTFMDNLLTWFGW